MLRARISAWSAARVRNPSGIDNEQMSANMNMSFANHSDAHSNSVGSMRTEFSEGTGRAGRAGWAAADRAAEGP